MRRRAALAAALAGVARAGQTGLKGIDCIADTACVFSDDANGQLCYYDLATGEASLLTADVGAPRDVQLSRDGTLVVASDWGRNAVAKITVATKKVATVSCLGEDRWTIESTDGDIPVPNVREIFSYSYETRRLGTFSYSYDFVDDDGCDAATAPEGIALLSGGRYAAATLSETGQVALVDLDDGRHKGLLDPDDASSMGAASSGEKVHGLAVSGTKAKPWVVGTIYDRDSGQSALFAVDPLTGHFERAVATAPKPSEWFDVEALPSTGADASAFVVLDRAAQGLRVPVVPRARRRLRRRPRVQEDVAVEHAAAVVDHGREGLEVALVGAHGPQVARDLGRKRVRNSQLQRLLARSFSARFG